MEHLFYSGLGIMKSMVISQLIRRKKRQVITFNSEPYFEFCIDLYILITSIIILSGAGCCMYFYLEHVQNMGSVLALIFLFVIIRTIRFQSLNFGFHSKPYQSQHTPVSLQTLIGIRLACSLCQGYVVFYLLFRGVGLPVHVSFILQILISISPMAARLENL